MGGSNVGDGSVYNDSANVEALVSARKRFRLQSRCDFFSGVGSEELNVIEDELNVEYVGVKAMIQVRLCQWYLLRSKQVSGLVFCLNLVFNVETCLACFVLLFNFALSLSLSFFFT
ncbi:uncharacterized protein LOC129300349 isoform X2 [Prosopis cineraria]|uniref:uncharacterized protein LOC129300349 isoform X2 n=1 Tax=Prosopis cineraria TaxID=364024 RepID=UPI0024103727|nr:uncharacterized protein LOC129300349 isoform X2 [Prosopis cineraria]